jgi:hypothetical protein
MHQEPLEQVAESGAPLSYGGRVSVCLAQSSVHCLDGGCKLIDRGRMQGDHVALRFDQPQFLRQGGPLGLQLVEPLHHRLDRFIAPADGGDVAVDLDRGPGKRLLRRLAIGG